MEKTMNKIRFRFVFTGEGRSVTGTHYGHEYNLCKRRPSVGAAVAFIFSSVRGARDVR